MAKQGKGSKNKGAGFERKIAKQLSEWSGVELVRTPLSGGHHWKGDIMPKDTSTDFPFHVECKCQEGWSFEQLFKSDDCKIMKWWEQCIGDCPEDKIPLLIFTRNHQPIYVIMLSSSYTHFRTKEHPKCIIDLVTDNTNLITVTLNWLLTTHWE